MITKETIQHISKLARLRLNDQEAIQISEQLSSILKHFEEISELDTKLVVPLVTPSEIAVHWRKDEVIQEVSPEKLVANAPERSGKLFKVPPVV